jgi:uncharacterized protein
MVDIIKKVINCYFREDNCIIAVYLHGSYSKNKVRSDSDIDLAILVKPNKKISSMELLKMSGDLEIELKKVIDIGVVSAKNLVYAKEVIANGLCILNNDNNAKDFCEMTLLSMYTDFQYERKEVLNAYRC